MDVPTLLSTVVSSLGVSLAAAWALATKLVDKKLDDEKEARKGEIKKEVDDYLDQAAAERKYEFEARKRLYEAIGPLRFQLLFACRELASRIYSHPQKQYDLSLRGYYGVTTLYRLLRPLAVCELIERQIAYADFSIDPEAVDLLRFKKAAFMALCSGKPILNHPSANWGSQEEHLFFDNVSLAAASLLCPDPTGELRLRGLEEFERELASGSLARQLTSLPNIFNDFSIEAKPIFWVRLVCFGYLCNELLRTAGARVGFDVWQYNVETMVAPTADDFFTARSAELEKAFVALAATKL